jgi:hypothetical protein
VGVPVDCREVDAGRLAGGECPEPPGWLMGRNVRRPHGAYSSALTAHGKPLKPNVGP